MAKISPTRIPGTAFHRSASIPAPMNMNTAASSEIVLISKESSVARPACSDSQVTVYTARV